MCTTLCGIGTYRDRAAAGEEERGWKWKGLNARYFQPHTLAANHFSCVVEAAFSDAPWPSSGPNPPPVVSQGGVYTCILVSTRGNGLYFASFYFIQKAKSDRPNHSPLFFIAFSLSVSFSAGGSMCLRFPHPVIPLFTLSTFIRELSAWSRQEKRARLTVESFAVRKRARDMGRGEEEEKYK